MGWISRQDYLRQGGSATPLGDKLDGLGFTALAPARGIIKAPHNLETTFRDKSKPDDVLLRELMHNFWTLGRSHWSWTAASSAASSDGGLVKGTVNFCACGGFNTNFAYMATTVMGIPGIEKGSTGPGAKHGKTWYDGNFITLPVDGIDSEWIGNVRSPNYYFSALKMLKFKDHFFCNYNGIIFDATANATHASTKTMVACDLKEISREESEALHADPMIKSLEVTNVSPHFKAKGELDLHTGRWLVLALGRETLKASSGDQGFSVYLLTNQAKVSQSEMDSFSLESGRTAKKPRG